MIDLTTFTERVTDLTGFEKLKNDDTEDAVIEFVCYEEDYGVIPEPVPANRVLPDWYKNLSQYVKGGNDNVHIGDSTVKRCAPFMEAMTAGWIIPLAAQVEFHAHDGYVEYKWDFHRKMVSSHDMKQVGGEAFPNSEWPVMKWHNFWCVRVPEGYSMLITSPFNRIEKRFQPFSGIVDVDRYFNFINAPFMWTGGEYDGVIEQGTPIIQVIPFKRDSFITDGVVRPMTEEEQTRQMKTQNRLGVNESAYREEMWVQKKGTRNLPYDPDG
ncbi:DUF6065 family protein [Haloferax larsenii]|uniref:Uncharacterized protein n=1 Tax=Haloferax larsenii TaxID=302484 RepID=A0A1H7N0F7_HALLR|nr:DUF6065 family protein [Haloferax larsenii]SEL16811.1 hypothetical protein SAMN04488691_103151 [Haloferax larsenii]